MPEFNKISLLEKAPETAARNLEDYFSDHIDAIIAYSGGVDSTLLVYVAHRALGNRMVAALADSPSLSRREFDAAVNFTRAHGIPLRIVQTAEMEDPLYRANQADRCYHCKKTLFQELKKLRKELAGPGSEASRPIFYGANLDDLEDHRPGMQAAGEASIRSPYLELGINKNTIRALCAYYGLEVAVKPAMPCMSSRILYGEEVTLEKLRQVEEAENFLYTLDLRVLRVRHHGFTARIEVLPQDFTKVLENRDKISQKFHELGFTYIALDLDGFHSGSLNTVLELPE
ncbi:MAG: ATP-dependent sacrificial sulfur transferase LarE [Candidatus Desulfatibia sp.]|uniref:ATP-dependent sacrificial sulfur transferase LarE n=1 Tax=Candidatus Desulfatibia sp. TaxID=3101189 RepID=UPI002F33C867